MATGSVGLATLAYWAANGKISGDGPSDPRERAMLMEQGWSPRSIKVGDRWVEYGMLAQPIAIPLAAIAQAWESYHATGQTPDVEAMAAAMPSALLDQSFLSGVSDLDAALSDPDRYAKQYAARTATGFVPFSALQRNLAQTIDPVVRDTHGAGMGDTTAATVRSIVRASHRPSRHA